MKINILKIILFILAFLMIAFTVYQVVNTYAIFYSEKESKININNATWNILVNNENISSGIEQEILISQFNFSTSEHVKAENFAPGMNADFLININPRNVSVAVKYIISIDEIALQNINNIALDSVEEINNNNLLIRTGLNEYTGIMSLNNIQNGNIDSIKVILNWVNNEVNNAEDTSIRYTNK